MALVVLGGASYVGINLVTNGRLFLLNSIFDKKPILFTYGNRLFTAASVLALNIFLIGA